MVFSILVIKVEDFSIQSNCYFQYRDRDIFGNVFGKFPKTYNLNLNIT